MREFIKLIRRKDREVQQFTEIIRKTLKRKDNKLDCVSLVGMQYAGEEIVLHFYFALNKEGQEDDFSQVRSVIKCNSRTLTKEYIVEEVENFKLNILSLLILIQEYKT